MTTTTNTPLDTLRDGALKATIWRREQQDGKPFYSVQLTRSYTDDAGKWHETGSFSGSELLRIARLADIAYSEILIYKTQDRGPQGEPK